MATSRTYGEACGIPRALDRVGERWALLVVRELMLGPKRFTDLKTGLPHASPNVLAQRLRELELRMGEDVFLGGRRARLGRAGGSAPGARDARRRLIGLSPMFRLLDAERAAPSLPYPAPLTPGPPRG